MTLKMNKVFIVAGEPSGDIHAAKLVSAIKVISPKTKFFGNGGDKMSESGVEIIHHINDLSVMGFIEGSEPEGIVVDADGNVYTGEVTGGEGGEGHIIRKFIKQ